MKKNIKQMMSLCLVFTMVISMSMPSYAGLGSWIEGAAEDIGDVAEDVGDAVGDVVDDVGDVADDVGDAIGDAAGEVRDWGEGAIEDVGSVAEDAYDWGQGAVEDAQDWTQGAVEDVGDFAEDAYGWTKGAAEDAYNWTDGAVEDTGDWLEGAAEDTGDWIEGAVEDTGEFVADTFASESAYNELVNLPALTIDESQMVNMLDPTYGTFSYLDNVREKKLSSNTYIKIKNELEKVSIPGHVVNFVLEEIAGVEGDDIGGAVADLLPGSLLYGDVIADVINDEINNDSFVDVNLYTETIKGNDDVEGFTAYYDMPVNGSFNKNALIVVTGLKYGKRDDFNVYVKTIDANGKEVDIPTVKMALNRREVAFVAEANNINSNIKNIRVVYDNDFDPPKEPSRLIADGIKDGINGAVPVFSPISNSARDGIVKVLNKLDMNELGGNGDVGVIIAENIVGEVPLVGTTLKAIGGIDWLAGLIRRVVGQVEVKSYAAVRSGRILVKGYASSNQLGTFVDGATTAGANGAIKTEVYDFEELTPDFKYFGSGWLPGSTLYCSTTGHANTVLNENDYGNVMAQTVVNFNEARGNAGIEFRINNVKGTQNDFQGYLAGIGFASNGRGEIFLGKQNHDWKGIKSVSAPISVGQDHVLKVLAVGKDIKVYLDGSLYIEVTDDSYRDGYIGYQVWNAAVNFDNFVVSENVPFDLEEYNFSSSKPHMDFSGETWSYFDDKASTKLRAEISSSVAGRAVLTDHIYENMIFDSQIKKVTSNGYAGLGFRLQENNNKLGYIAGVQKNSAGHAELFLGKLTPSLEIIKSRSIDFTSNEDVKLTVVVHGNIIQVFVDGKSLMSAVDNTYAKGYAGYIASNTTVLFDNLEVQDSELSIKNAEIPAGATSDSSGQAVGGLEEKFKYDFSYNVPMTVYDGSFVRHKAYEHSLFGRNTNSADGLVIFGNDDFENGVIETNITLYKSDDGSKTGNSGIVFRASNPKAGHNNIQAYYAGLRTDLATDKDGVMLGILDNGSWKELAFYKADIQPVSNGDIRNYTLKVVAFNNQIDVYVNGKRVISKMDSTYTKGSVGLRTYKYPSIFQYIDVQAPAGESGRASTPSETSTASTPTASTVNTSTGIHILNSNQLDVRNINFAISFTHNGNNYYTSQSFDDFSDVKVAELKLNNSGSKNSSGWIMGNYLDVKTGSSGVAGLDIKNAVGHISDVKIAMTFKKDGKKYVVYKSFDDLDSSNMFKLLVEGGTYFEQNDTTRGDYLVPTY